jgi:hypothetical protein
MPYRLRDFWFETQKKIKEICKRKKSSKLGRHDLVEGFLTSTLLRDYLGRLYLAHDE